MVATVAVAALSSSRFSEVGMGVFLLNPDGSFPAWADVAALEAAGVKFVVPTEAPRPEPGYRIEEGEPVLDEYGTWRQTWVQVALPPPRPAPVPQVVTMRQARLALLGAGLLDSVDAALAAIQDATERRAAQITWEYAQEVRRNDPMVITLGDAFGLTEAQKDELFVVAASL
jgi:hypothetical protein